LIHAVEQRRESRRRSNATYNGQYRRNHSGEQDARHLLDGFGSWDLPAIQRSAHDGSHDRSDLGGKDGT
jgi:hypothetical protein